MNYKTIIGLLFTIILFFAVLGSNTTALSSAYNDPNNLIVKAQSFTPDFSKHMIEEDQVGVNRYEVTIPLSAFNKIDAELYGVIINKLTDHGINVYLNDQLIYNDGDMDNGRANFKYGFHSFTFSDNLLTKNNHLVIETYALYKSGLETKGIIITDYKHAASITENLKFLGPYILYFGIGMLFFSIIFVLIVYFMFGKKEITLLYSALATICIIVYFSEYMTINLFMDYLLYKKICLLSLYVSVSFYIVAASKFFHNKLLNYAVYILTGSFFIVTLFSQNMIQYKSFYNYWYLAFLVLVAIAFILSIINLKQSEFAYLILISFLSVGLYAGISIISDILDKPHAINSPVVYIVTMALLPMLIGVDTIYQHRLELDQEKLLRYQEYLNANTDELTNTWNQRYLLNSLATHKQQAILAIFDLDNFKSVNDLFGHPAGDLVLKNVAKTINSHLKRNEYLCRYGGDEFVLITTKGSYIEFTQLIEQIRKAVEQLEISYDNHKIKVTLSAGIYQLDESISAKEMLKYADKALRSAKESGKNQING